MQNATTETQVQSQKVSRIADGVQGILERWFRDGQLREVRFAPFDGSECKLVQGSRATDFPFTYDDSALKACMAEFECPPIEPNIFTGAGALGCYPSAENRLGRIIACKHLDDLGNESIRLIAVPYADGEAVIDPYTGAWEECEQESDQGLTKLGCYCDENNNQLGAVVYCKSSDQLIGIPYDSTQSRVVPFSGVWKECPVEVENIPAPLQEVVCCPFVDIDSEGKITNCFVEGILKCISKTDGVSQQSLGLFTDDSLCTGYTVTGTSVAVSELGKPVVGGKFKSHLVNGPGSWAFPNKLISAFNIKVKEIGDATNPPLLANSDGTTRELCLGETVPQSTDSPGEIVCQPPGLVLNSGDKIIIDTIELCIED